jgi:hypothetical protein
VPMAPSARMGWESFRRSRKSLLFIGFSFLLV